MMPRRPKVYEPNTNRFFDVRSIDYFTKQISVIDEERGRVVPYRADEVGLIWPIGIKDLNKQEIYTHDILVVEHFDKSGVMMNREMAVCYWDEGFNAIMLKTYGKEAMKNLVHLDTGNGYFDSFMCVRTDTKIIGHYFIEPNLIDNSKVRKKILKRGW